MDIKSYQASKNYTDKEVKTVDDRITTLTQDFNTFRQFNVTNLFTNGDFNQGTSYWATVTSTMTATNKTLTATGNGAGVEVGISQAISTLASNKYYVAIKAKPLDLEGTLQIRAINSNEILAQISAPTNILTPLSAIFTYPSTASNSVMLRLKYADKTTQNGKRVEFNNALSINLTEAFGSGNEPDKEEMDELIAYFPDSWFDGTVDFADHKWFVVYMLNKLRTKNEEIDGINNELNNYTSTNDLSSQNTGKGASLIGISDEHGVFTASNVEACLYELSNGINTRKIEHDNLSSRVDTIITTPVESVSAEEIIDARYGEPTLGAKIDKLATGISDNYSRPRLFMNETIVNATGLPLTFSTFYHVFNMIYKTTGAIYAIQTPSTAVQSQAIYKSVDYGNTWTKMGDIAVSTSTGARLLGIFVEPRKETIVILKCNNINASPPTYAVETYDSALTLIGSLDIGTKKWHASTHNVDATVLNGTYNDVIMFAEYADTAAGAVASVKVWKTTNRGATWTTVFEQIGDNGTTGTGEVRHFHTLQVDPFTNNWWLSSGDSNSQCKIWRSQDDGVTWTLLFSGSQGERTLSFIFEEDYVYYGMDNPDAGTPSYIYRIDRATMTKQAVAIVYNNLAVYGLTKTFFPDGFLVWLICETSSTQSNKYKIQFYSYKENKLLDVAEIDSSNLSPSYGFVEASRYQSLQDGSLFACAAGMNLYSIYGGNTSTRTPIVKIKITI